jgi:hypothetical protein
MTHPVLRDHQWAYVGLAHVPLDSMEVQESIVVQVKLFGLLESCAS